MERLFAAGRQVLLHSEHVRRVRVRGRQETQTRVGVRDHRRAHRLAVSEIETEIKLGRKKSKIAVCVSYKTVSS